MSRGGIQKVSFGWEELCPLFALIYIAVCVGGCVHSAMVTLIKHHTFIITYSTEECINAVILYIGIQWENSALCHADRHTYSKHCTVEKY